MTHLKNVAYVAGLIGVEECCRVWSVAIARIMSVAVAFQKLQGHRCRTSRTLRSLRPGASSNAAHRIGIQRREGVQADGGKQNLGWPQGHAAGVHDMGGVWSVGHEGRPVRWGRKRGSAGLEARSGREAGHGAQANTIGNFLLFVQVVKL